MRAATVVQQLCKSCRTCFKFYCMFYFTCDRSLTPNTHRRRRRDATVELSCVGGVYTNSRLAHDDCRRVPSQRRHDATRLRCRQICSDSSRLSQTGCVRTPDATQLDSCVASAVCTGLEAFRRHVFTYLPIISFIYQRHGSL